MIGMQQLFRRRCAPSKPPQFATILPRLDAIAAQGQRKPRLQYTLKKTAERALAARSFDPAFQPRVQLENPHETVY
jgi:hypothetical protein